MEYGQKRISPLLAQILAQMQQQQQFQPQSYGALAAGLGAQAINQNSINKVMAQEQAQRTAQQSALARALSKEPQSIQLDTLSGQPEQLQQTRINPQVQSLAGNLPPEVLQQATAAKLARMINPSPEDSPFAKINPAQYTPESVAAFQGGGGKDFSALKPRPDEGTLPADIRVAQFLFPNDEKKQREFLQKKASSDLPAQIQVALWASDGDDDKARELVRKKLEGKDEDLSLGGLMAGVVQKLIDGKELTKGEQAAMDWYKQNPLAGLLAILGAKAGTTVED